MNEPTSTEKDMKKLKRELEGWREVILQLHTVLLWEKSWYAGVITGVSTTLFLLLWLLEPSLLTTLSCMGLFATLLDYLVPTLSTSIYSPSQWTGVQEKQFENICRTLIHTYGVIVHQVVAFKDLKVTSPKLYYSLVIVSLSILAYIGNKVNNLILTYLFVTTILLLPGLSHHGIIHKYYQLFLHSVANSLKSLQGGTKLKAN